MKWRRNSKPASPMANPYLVQISDTSPSLVSPIFCDKWAQFSEEQLRAMVLRRKPTLDPGRVEVWTREDLQLELNLLDIKAP